MRTSYQRSAAPVNTSAVSATVSAALPVTSVQQDTTPAVDAIGTLHFEGNIIPHAWYQHPALRYEDGKANLVAVTVLGDICYWYRPTVLRDEQGGHVVSVTKKFHADKLHWDHEQRGRRFGLTKRQVQDGIAFLKAAGIITCEIRDGVVLDSGVTLYNQVYIEPVPAAIAALCALVPLPKTTPEPPSDPSRLNGNPPTSKRTPPPGKTDTPARSAGRSPTLKRVPNTKSSTKTSPETLNVGKNVGEGGTTGRKSTPSTVNAEETDAFKHLVIEPVERVEELTGDLHSRDRYVQLRQIALDNGYGDAWDSAIASLKRRLGRTDLALVENAGAWFDTAVVRELDKHGIPVLPAGSTPERAEVNGLIGASLAAAQTEARDA